MRASLGGLGEAPGGAPSVDSMGLVSQQVKKKAVQVTGGQLLYHNSCLITSSNV